MVLYHYLSDRARVVADAREVADEGVEILVSGYVSGAAR